MTAVVPDLTALVYGDDPDCEAVEPDTADRCPAPAAWLLLIPCGCSVRYCPEHRFAVDLWLQSLADNGVTVLRCRNCPAAVEACALTWETI